MIVAHLSDLHLGFRAYGRVERGADVRERDVATAFERAVREVTRLRPDVMVVSGDVFDRPDPPAGALVAVARVLEGLRGELPDMPVLMVAGPRDTPRRPGDPGALAVLDSFPNVEAATGLMRSILIERLHLHACLVPYRALVREPPVLPEPDPRMRWNLLVLHASVEPGPPEGPAPASRKADAAGRRDAPAHPDASGVAVDPDEWDYLALGGPHRATAFAPRARCPGSLERVGLDPWDEAADEKGFLSFDLERGEARFHAIPGRPVVALAPVKVGQGDPERVRRRVREVTNEVPGGITHKIVRLRLQGATPTDLLALQGDPLRELRGRALHLTVEAGAEPRAPAEAWLPLDAPRLLREAASSELARDGRLDDRAAALLSAWLPDDEEPLERAHGALDALDGEVAGLGRVSTSVPEGLTAVIGGAGGSRRGVWELLVRVGRTGPPDAVAALWSGDGFEGLDGAVEAAVRAVAESRGLHLIDAALERAGAGPPAGGRVAAGRTGEPTARTDGAAAGRGAVRVDPDQVAAELRAAERELREARAEAVEADGDLEAATMDWLRERQDAETTLNAYRDRARELRARVRRLEEAGPGAPCPTCGRVLAEHHEEVLGELRDAWESIVQDGGWWRARWEQLEPKPAHVRELEGRTLRLHAALEAGSERVELLRARLAELGGGPRDRREIGAEGRPGGAGRDGARSDETPSLVVEALLRVRAARLARARDMVLDRASRFVCRISGGRILALTAEEGGVRLQGSEGVLAPLSEEDLAAGRIAVRLAAASLVAAGGRVLASLPIEEPFDALDEEARLRALQLAKRLLREVPRIVLFTRGEAVDARPELFDYVLEVREEGAPFRPALRPAAAGPGRVTLKVAVPPAPSRVHG